MTDYYPAYLNIAGRRAVVIGGGEVAERKTAQLLASGADVTLVSPGATPELERIASEGRLRWVRRAYVVGDLAGAWLAVAATDDPEVQRSVHAEAEREKTLLNVVDVAELCGFIAPSIVQRGPVTVAVSTGGASPALARKIRELMGGTQNPPHYDHDTFCRCIEWSDAADALADVRAELKAQGRSASPEAWQEAMDEQLLDLVRAGKDVEVRRRLRSALLSDAEP
ncbi:MAG: bifunctional precorrin-2 dehydrogenase/sirohydrochlorin ferrochelatase [Chloroflexota bacterium]|nr:bifunctional precorrin-2 dehydrogenase/sirohydrochlorin ferrochelatase [Chloroflexota bacterium]MDE2886344.1 bifunctional precorrin-2 dehydrogenase/sirohydrochlorin ferrochelatase [Chloroflexota bacterium]